MRRYKLMVYTDDSSKGLLTKGRVYMVKTKKDTKPFHEVILDDGNIHIVEKHRFKEYV